MVAPVVMAAGITAASTLAGSMLGGKGSDKLAIKSNEQLNADNIQYQKDFAQQGIQWKVADAKAAGIHPLYALGAQTNSFTPSSIPYQSKGPKRIGGVVADVGQNIARAVAATQTKEQLAQTALTTENMKLQNDLLRTQIGNQVAKQPATPGRPSATVIPGQGDSREAGVRPSYSYVKNRDGSLDVVPSQDFTDRNQNFISGIVPEMKWFLRNQLGPAARDMFWSPNPSHKYPLEKVDGKLYYRRGSSLIPYKR